MESLALAALSLALVAGTASASTTVPRVDAVADASSAAVLSVSCRDPQIQSGDAELVLGRHSPVWTRTLEHHLALAVDEACAQNVARIVVTRRGTAVAWSPALASDRDVAIALRW